jgi:hypothetical protein
MVDRGVFVTIGARELFSNLSLILIDFNNPELPLQYLPLANTSITAFSKEMYAFCSAKSSSKSLPKHCVNDVANKISRQSTLPNSR